MKFNIAETFLLQKNSAAPIKENCNTMHVSVLGIKVFLAKRNIKPYGRFAFIRHVPATSNRTSNLLIAKIILYPLDHHGRYETFLFQIRKYFRTFNILQTDTWLIIRLPPGNLTHVFTPFIELKTHDLNTQTIFNTRNHFFFFLPINKIYPFMIIRARNNNDHNFQSIFDIIHTCISPCV